ncbi:MAG TPA: hypothetical protein VEA69_16910 [Tepidisphaeraceae bacterium]|nr:hypothetical protein [Tepidisphaeraceae bacterium]
MKDREKKYSAKVRCVLERHSLDFDNTRTAEFSAFVGEGTNDVEAFADTIVEVVGMIAAPLRERVLLRCVTMLMEYGYFEEDSDAVRDRLVDAIEATKAGASKSA